MSGGTTSCRRTSPTATSSRRRSAAPRRRSWSGRPTPPQSEWVRAEADMARNQKKLIQTSIDGRDPPMPFNQLHYVSLADWDGSDDHPGWSKVKESLAALCGAPGAEATGPGRGAARRGAGDAGQAGAPGGARRRAAAARRAGAAPHAEAGGARLEQADLHPDRSLAAGDRGGRRAGPDARPLLRAPGQRERAGQRSAAGRAGRTGNAAAGDHRPRRILAGSRDQRRGGISPTSAAAPRRMRPSSPGSIRARPSTPTARMATGGGSGSPAA